MLLKAEAISKSFGPREVLRSVNMEVHRGDVIGLVGRNGVGKTTMLRILMGQLRPDTGEIAIRTDSIGYLSQFPVLDRSRTVGEIVGEPYGRIAVLAGRMAELEEIMASGAAGDPGTGADGRDRGESEIDWNEVAGEYARLQEEYGSAGGHGIGSKARDALERVGFPEEMVGRKVSELSGGELTKVMLARVLVQADEADLLFLDEPTSHLDVETVEWLEAYLMESDAGVIVVSHDRYFMDRVVTSVMELENGVTASYPGNYSAFTGKKAAEMERQRKIHLKNRIKRKQHERKADELFRKNPYGTAHKTRQKMLDRMDHIEAPVEHGPMSVKIDAAAKSGKNVIMAKGLGIERGNRQIVRDVTFDLDVGDKLGIFGPNGAGKTSLVKALMSEIPHHGELWVAPGARLGYFAQGHDLLENYITPEQQLLRALGNDERLKARTILARFLIKGEDAERPISSLSGGERTRVALALLIAERRNLLVMDEPTNYLDIPAKHAVESALKEYPGTLLIVTHDRYFMDSVCNKVGELRDGSLEIFNGTYSEMKGRETVTYSLENAVAYRVVAGFTNWATRKKYRIGERVLIAGSEVEDFQWAMDNGKLRRIRGGEKKKVKGRNER